MPIILLCSINLFSRKNDLNWVCVLNKFCIFLQLYELFGSEDLREIVCDPMELARRVLFPSSKTLSEKSISSALCQLNVSLIPDMTRAVQQQLDMSKIVRAVSRTSLISSSAPVSPVLCTYRILNLIR